MKPTLLILAAGLSSRYKLGLKQMDAFGPSGETLLDYAIYDAIMAGFAKAVFVIRKETKADFEKRVTSKYNNKIDYDFVFQEMDDLPNGFSPPALRQKPWGTGHAVWVARNIIKESFAVINADDFYDRESYKIMETFLKNQTSKERKYSLVGFNLQNTLSEFGHVSRGICTVKDGQLIDIDERTKIYKRDGVVLYINEQGDEQQIAADSTVSMNFWGFSPDIFSGFEHSFKAFLKQNIDNIQSEFFLPYCIKELIKKENITVKVLKSSGKWIGVTNPDDKRVVKEKLKTYCEAGLYPTPLF